MYMPILLHTLQVRLGLTVGCVSVSLLILMVAVTTNDQTISMSMNSTVVCVLRWSPHGPQPIAKKMLTFQVREKEIVKRMKTESVKKVSVCVCVCTQEREREREREHTRACGWLVYMDHDITVVGVLSESLWVCPGHIVYGVRFRVL